jgi:hypothetical protein
MKEGTMIGSAEPIVIAGIRYDSIFRGSIETCLAMNWILYRIRDAGGEPVIIRGHLVILERWFWNILSQSPWLAELS